MSENASDLIFKYYEGLMNESELDRFVTHLEDNAKLRQLFIKEAMQRATIARWARESVDSEWVFKYYEGLLSESEVETLTKRLEKDRHLRHAFSKEAITRGEMSTWAKDKVVKTEFPVKIKKINPAKSRRLKRVQHSAKKKFPLYWVGAVAAVVVIAFSAIFAILTNQFTPETPTAPVHMAKKKPPEETPDLPPEPVIPKKNPIEEKLPEVAQHKESQPKEKSGPVKETETLAAKATPPLIPKVDPDPEPVMREPKSEATPPQQNEPKEIIAKGPEKTRDPESESVSTNIEKPKNEKSKKTGAEIASRGTAEQNPKGKRAKGHVPDTVPDTRPKAPRIPYLANALAVAKVEYIEGVVDTYVGNSKKYAISKGDDFHVGQSIATNYKSSITFRFKDKTTLRLHQNTELQHVFDLSKQKKGVGKYITLKQGTIDLNVRRQSSRARLFIRTPHAQVTVLGTKFHVSSDSEKTSVDVARGKVWFMRLKDKQHTIVNGGYRASTDESGNTLHSFNKKTGKRVRKKKSGGGGFKFQGGGIKFQGGGIQIGQ